ncbi:MAG: hypothetical protein FWD34_07200 [Oscillospiraceae bacterium]|nr:hypothetical protein [Oscillospiraceae bacterium]
MNDVTFYKNQLNEIVPRYVGKVFPVGEIPLIGLDIIKHVHGCERVLVSCATLGEEFDRLLRQTQLTDMAGAVILDTLAGEYVEEFCNKQDTQIIGVPPYGFSPGYGDYPLSVNRDILNMLNAQKAIGLCVTDEFILTPQKSITRITGIL